jgi:cation diffusion facilitator CzcD-associated flavoprotein CzcO
VIAYLEDYARVLGLAPRFGERVSAIRRDGEGWIVGTSAQEWRARNVVVATGYTRVPNRPNWPGLPEFAGQVLHSSEYRSGAAFAGKRVLVVGFGNSGGEIALDLCEHGAKTAISLRSAVNMVTRDFLGLPILAWGLLLVLLPDRMGDAIARLVSRIVFGSLDALGFRELPYGAMTQIRRHGRIPLIDVGTVARIRSQEIKLLPGLYFCGFKVVPTGMLREMGREAQRIAESIAGKA